MNLALMELHDFMLSVTILCLVIRWLLIEHAWNWALATVDAMIGAGHPALVVGITWKLGELGAWRK